MHVCELSEDPQSDANAILKFSVEADAIMDAEFSELMTYVLQDLLHDAVLLLITTTKTATKH